MNGQPPLLPLHPFQRRKFQNDYCHLPWIMRMVFVLSILLLFIFAVPFRTADKAAQLVLDQEFFSSTAGTTPSLPVDTRKNSGTSHPSSSHFQLSSSRHSLGFDGSQGDIYILVDTSQHRLFVKQKDRILYTAVASTGKGTVLTDPRNPTRHWTFDSPKGTFRVLKKLKNPVWIRPNWVFIEEGDLIPEKMSDRLMPGVLGSYALEFGDGYFIHGALYSNLLGQDVTHGCIQLHPKDLQFVFETVPLGTPLTLI